MNNLQSIPMNPDVMGAVLAYGVGIAFFVFIVLIALLLVPMCLIFTKAGRKWWEAIIPFYNIYVLTIITGQPWWILFGFFIPVVGWLVGIYLYYHLSKRFGYDIPFTIGLVLLPFIFVPILGFGKATYIAPTTESQK